MNTARTVARRITVTGRVQGVGFRPFIYRLAHELGIRGWVFNAAGEVRIAAEATPDLLATFERRIVESAPPLARPEVAISEAAGVECLADFAITESHEAAPFDIHVPPDQFACDDCLSELSDPVERRYGYPFINCTQCGPRYTIIRAMPYDRPNTSMAEFPLCKQCASEYANPLDRRFHAQPLACPECGPALTYVDPAMAAGPIGCQQDADGIIQRITDDIAAGLILAVRGIGGYHLVCDAANEAAVARLRQRKRRPTKPFAVMIPAGGQDGMDRVREISDPTELQARSLRSPERPIVLVNVRRSAGLAPSVAPGLDEVGIMLPYSPLHHLLLSRFGGPIVATSGNISGEPVITDAEEAGQRLSDIADRFVHHNRPIQRPADDPVIREIAGRSRPIRLGRGTAPLEVALPAKVRVPTLAVGAFLKNTVALAWEDRAVVSPHVGDLGSRRSREIFEQVVDDLQSLYGVRAQRVACDAHPDYFNSRWARDCGLPSRIVYHHHAHASALVGEYRIEQPALVFTWDGVGLGADGTLWGSEGLLGRPGDWQRAASFRPFRLPGGDRCVYEPWRTLLSIVWESGLTWSRERELSNPLLRHAWASGLNSPLTSAAGRLFDAAAVVCNMQSEASYDGEAPIRLEAACSGPAGEAAPMPLEPDEEGVWRADWAPLFEELLTSTGTLPEKAVLFHDTMIATLVAQATQIRNRCGVSVIGLTGGAFQNRRLAGGAKTRLERAGFTVHIPELLPVNDGGISFGQIIEAVSDG